MRKTLNENPLVQIAMLGVAGVVLAAIFLMRMGGGAEPATTNAPVTPTAPSASAPAEASTPASPSASTPAPASSASGTDRDGLPREYARAAASDRPVAIFVVRGKPVSDRVVEGYADRLAADSDAAVFVIHPRDLADWVRVVGTVGVDRTPALVAVAPSKGSGAPAASVSYGFRNYESVRQAVADASYDGPVRGYDPG